MGRQSILKVLFIFLFSIKVLASGPLMMVGGSLDDNNNSIYETFFKYAGGKAARISIITAASKQNYKKNQQLYIENLANKGIYAEWIEVHVDNPEGSYSNENLKQLDSLTGFLFGGGSQNILKELFVNSDGAYSPVLKKIIDKHNSGAPILGTSAGAAVMPALPAPMIAGGWSYESVLNGSYKIGEKMGSQF